MGELRILHLSSAKNWRGGEQQIAYLLDYSRSVGIDVHVLSRKGSPMSQWCAENDIPFSEAGFVNGLDVRTALKVRNLAVKLSADAVHVHSGNGHSIAYLAIKIGMGTPIIVHRRIDFPLKKSGPSLNKYNHPNVKAVICVSNAVREMVIRSIEDSSKAVKVYGGVDFKQLSNPKQTSGFLKREFGIESSKFIVANISALAPHKDYPTFLKAVKLYNQENQNCHFFIVGDGDLAEELKKMAAEMDIMHTVTFTGFRNDTRAILSEIDVFLTTSSREGLGTAVIEALYHGKPVIASKGGGIPELVRDGEEGLLCEIGAAECLSKALVKLLNDDELREKLGKQAHQRSLQFSSDAMGKGVVEVYHKVLTDK
jgi:glycosyltransferase involved in cell wall biosynthesis